MNHLPTPAFVALVVMGAGAAVLTVPALTVAAAIYVERRWMNR